MKYLSPIDMVSHKESRASLMRKSVLTEDLEPIEDTFLEQLRRASGELSEFPAVRKCFVTALRTALFLAKEEQREERYKSLLHELRQVGKEFEHDELVRSELAKSLFYSLS